MGMFDTIRFYGDAPLLCADGHPLRELQSKDLECSMDEFAVHRGRLYRVGRERAPSAEADSDGRLSILHRRAAAPTALTAEVVAYASCEECRPVLYLRDSALHWDYVNERHPWCEWRLVFVAGQLERVEAVRVETREAVREKLRKDGLEVLDDDDRLARLHYKRRCEEEDSTTK